MDYLGGGTNSGGKYITVTNSYSIGNVIDDCKNAGAREKYSGGLIGQNYNKSKVTNSYWNIETSGWKTSPGGGTGKTTDQMKQQSTYVGWDFTNTWYMDEETGYPKLQWEKLIK